MERKHSSLGLRELGNYYDLNTLQCIRNSLPQDKWSPLATGILRTLNRMLNLEELSGQDELTGLPNRRRFNEVLNKEIAAAHRYGHALSLAIFDIDYFKKFNDTYGHDTGDEVLRHVADACLNHIRLSDTVGRGSLCARIGGEEFGIVLPHTPVHGAYTAAERLRKYLESSKVNYQGRDIGVTISLGVAGYHSLHEADLILSKEAILEDRNHLIKNADIALYKAKGNGSDSEGRNRTVIYERIYPTEK